MNNYDKVVEIAESLRQEPYLLSRNNCIHKSRRLKKACAPLGVKVQVVICLGNARAKIRSRDLTVPVIHAWGEVEGRRIETSRPLGHAGVLGIVPMHIKPLIALRF